ncbi:MAG: immunoglobulin domain-containing protein, partial [Lachnospiraceae bacterium]|nr:immunoglobulin domain-containing protein [Lachnospiraceae bacterium]
MERLIILKNQMFIMKEKKHFKIGKKKRFSKALSFLTAFALAFTSVPGNFLGVETVEEASAASANTSALVYVDTDYYEISNKTDLTYKASFTGTPGNYNIDVEEGSEFARYFIASFRSNEYDEYDNDAWVQFMKAYYPYKYDDKKTFRSFVTDSGDYPYQITFKLVTNYYGSKDGKKELIKTSSEEKTYGTDSNDELGKNGTNNRFYAVIPDYDKNFSNEYDYYYEDYRVEFVKGVIYTKENRQYYDDPFTSAITITQADIISVNSSEGTNFTYSADFHRVYTNKGNTKLADVLYDEYSSYIIDDTILKRTVTRTYPAADIDAKIESGKNGNYPTYDDPVNPYTFFRYAYYSYYSVNYPTIKNYTITAYDSSGHSKAILGPLSYDIKTNSDDLNKTVQVMIDVDGDGVRDYVRKFKATGSVYYGKRYLGEMNIDYKYQKIGFDVGVDSENTDLSVAIGSEAKMAVALTNVVTDIYTVDYTWYEIDGEGNETVVPDAQASAYSVDYTDETYKTKYKCVITGYFEDGGTTEKEVSFTISPESDYNLEDVGIKLSTDSENEKTTRLNADVNAGDIVTLYAEATASDAYSLQYYWTKDKSYAADKETSVLNENLDESEYTFTVVNSDVGKTLTYYLTVAATADGVEEYYVYKFTIKVQGFGTTGTDYNDPNIVYMTDGSVTLDPGESLPEGVNATYTWFKPCSKADTNGLTKGTDYIAIPTEYTYDLAKDSEGKLVCSYTAASYDYYIKDDTASGSYTVSSEGIYPCVIEYSYEDESSNTVTSTVNSYYKVIGDTNLLAYAKNNDVYAAVGKSASLSVFASNKDESAYPITVNWQKLNLESAEFEDILDDAGEVVTGKTYQISAVAKEDYGVYRAVVSDGVNSAKVIMYLRTPADTSFYDDSTTVFFKDNGDKVTMTPDIQFDSETNAKYTWYKGVDVANVDKEELSDLAYSKIDGVETGWIQITGEESQNYSFTVDNDSYGAYKCVVSYEVTSSLEGGTVSSVEQQSKDFIFEVRPYLEATLEATTAKNQIKKIGDSASYGVRFVTNEKNIDTSKIQYQWYRSDKNNPEGDATAEYLEPISGATNATYDISSMKTSDYGYLIATATYTEADGTKKIWSEVFYTAGYTSLTFDKSKETRYAVKGKSVELGPNVTHEDSETITYQWYMNYPDDAESIDAYSYYNSYFIPQNVYYSEEYGNYMANGDRYIMIPGANKRNLTIDNVGDNDYTDYILVAYKNGAPCLTYEVGLLEGTEDEITIELMDGIAVNQPGVLGGSATFGINAKSSTGQKLTYTWYHGNSEYESSLTGFTRVGEANSNSYTVERIVDESFGYYVVMVENEDGTRVFMNFRLDKSSGLEVDYGAIQYGEVKGVSTTFNGTASLVTDATAASGYENAISYTWYKATEAGIWTRYDISALETEDKIYNQEVYSDDSTLVISGVTEDDLGYYRCEITTAAETTYAYFYVYVNTHLSTTASSEYPIADASGNLTMYVNATADAGEEIHYQWSKLVDPDELNLQYQYRYNNSITDPNNKEAEYVDIVGATNGQYVINGLKKADYGKYRCVVNTRGEVQYYTFEITPSYSLKSNQLYVRKGDNVKLELVCNNQATDVTYNYKWYEFDTTTETFSNIGEGGTSFSTAVADVSYTADDFKNGYVEMKYAVKVSDVTNGVDKAFRLKDVDVTKGGIRVIPELNLSSSLPSIPHPFDARCDVQSYRVAGAKYIKITFDSQSMLSEEKLHVIDANGNYVEITSSSAKYHSMVDGEEITESATDYNTDKEFVFNGKTEHTLLLPGDTATFLLFGNEKADSYGYGIKSIEEVSEEEALEKLDPTGNKDVIEQIKAAKAASASAANAASGESLTVAKKKIVIAPGKTGTVSYKATNASGQSVKATATTAKEKVATVDVTSDSIITISVPKKATRGAKTVITVKNGATTQAITVKVKNPTKKLKAKKKKVKVKAKKKVKLTFKIKAQNPKKP